MTWSVQIEGVSKRYRLGEQEQYLVLRDSLTRGFSRLLGRTPAAAEPETIWALRDVTATIAPGEIVGLIGRNGAGKSTLLKIVSRVTDPTEGRIRIRGDVGSLLEVGAGFHPELTGHENIYLSGSILGMKRRDIKRKLDEIIDFSELEQFLDTPVKRYSVGMYMRLAFTVAAHLDAEVLAVDEILAVGDRRFRQKCLGKMNDVARSGRTVLFVSHDLDVTTRLCDRCLLLEGGRLLEDGPAHTVAGQYLALNGVVARVGERLDLRGAERSGAGDVRIQGVEIVSVSGDAIGLVLDIDADEPTSIPSIGVTISGENGVLLVSVDTAESDEIHRVPAGPSRLALELDRTPLAPGRYQVGLRLADPVTTRIGSGAFDQLEPAFVLDVEGSLRAGARRDSMLDTSLRVRLV